MRFPRLVEAADGRVHKCRPLNRGHTFAYNPTSKYQRVCSWRPPNVPLNALPRAPKRLLHVPKGSKVAAANAAPPPALKRKRSTGSSELPCGVEVPRITLIKIGGEEDAETAATPMRFRGAGCLCGAALMGGVCSCSAALSPEPTFSAQLHCRERSAVEPRGQEPTFQEQQRWRRERATAADTERSHGRTPVPPPPPPRSPVAAGAAPLRTAAAGWWASEDGTVDASPLTQYVAERAVPIAVPAASILPRQLQATAAGAGLIAHSTVHTVLILASKKHSEASALRGCWLPQLIMSSCNVIELRSCVPLSLDWTSHVRCIADCRRQSVRVLASFPAARSTARRQPTTAAAV